MTEHSKGRGDGKDGGISLPHFEGVDRPCCMDEQSARDSVGVPSLPGHGALQDLRARLDGLGLRPSTALSLESEPVESILINGENKDVLSALRPNLTGAIKCAYLDPPYNNRENYGHYGDALAHEVWLKRVTDRLTVIASLLTQDGSVWISIDDSEMHYLKVKADTIFGRENFVTTIIWEHRTTRENRRVFSNNHEYVLVYAKNAAEFKCARNRLPATPELLSRYRNLDADPRGPWQSVSANVQAGHATEAQFYELVSPSGRVHVPPPGRCWIYSKERMLREIEAGNVVFGRNGFGVPRIKQFAKNMAHSLTPETLWTAQAVGTTTDAKKHTVRLFGRDVFDTPKPEKLIMRVLHIATNPGDLVLDPYLGSGTTTAVALKMGRPSVGIESGHQAVSHCAQRMRLVSGGEKGGISSQVGWRGGGGFLFYDWQVKEQSSLVEARQSGQARRSA